jgi:hypothetical protein
VYFKPTTWVALMTRSSEVSASLPYGGKVSEASYLQVNQALAGPAPSSHGAGQWPVEQSQRTLDPARGNPIPRPGRMGPL